jgi:hypothetical protein
MDAHDPPNGHSPTLGPPDDPSPVGTLEVSGLAPNHSAMLVEESGIRPEVMAVRG